MRFRRNLGLLASAAAAATPLWSTPASAATPTPDTLVSVCSGVSLPPSVVTGIMGPVVNGIYNPIETNTNQTLGILGGLGFLGLPAPLSTDVTGLLNSAASGSDIGLNVIAEDGTLVGPSDPCNAVADGYTLGTDAGIAIGGNMISGLGATGQEAQAGEIDSIAIGNRAATDASAVSSIALGPDATIGSSGTGSIALGSGSTVNVANSVAIGAGSVAIRGVNTGYSAFGLAGLQNSVGEFSVGAVGAERQITNVAAGSAPTDAVNLAQLQGVASLIPTDAVQYDDPSHATVTLDGAGGTTVTNVAPGALNATSTDAVNGSQLFATNQQLSANTTAITNLQIDVTSLQGNVTTIQGDITNLQTQINNISVGAAGPVQYSDAATPTVPNGGTPSNDVTLVGGGPGPVGLHNVADGVIAAGSTDAVNGGQLNATNQAVAGAQATADTALDVANNSVQYDDATHSSVTFDPGNPPAAVHNVAAGVGDTDAVNVGQMNNAVSNVVNTAVTQANAYTDARLSELGFDLDHVRKDSRAGTAAALAAAGLPQPMDPGKSMIAGGVGVYRGKAAFSLGLSHVPDNGKSVWKVGVTYDSSEHVGASGGFGVQF
jgi:autotransporter adhesin